MLRIISNARVLTQISECCNYQNMQSVRWARKPRKPIWMPTAKSKLFRIPVKPKIPLEETLELRRLYNNYRTLIKSIRAFLNDKYNVELQATTDTEQLKKAFEEDFARCSEINQKWNEDIRVIREERVAKQLAEEIKFAKNRLEEMQLKEVTRIAEADEIVRKEKTLVATFITSENLDEVIDKALDNPVEYNFAIDLDGNRIFGRDTKPEVANIKQASVKQ